MFDVCELMNCAVSGWESLYTAYAISDAGDIIGAGVIDGEHHAFLITTVPVPATAWLFGSGLLILFTGIRRRM